jgi:hypothetical protein
MERIWFVPFSFTLGRPNRHPTVFPYLPAVSWR